MYNNTGKVFGVTIAAGIFSVIWIIKEGEMSSLYFILRYILFGIAVIWLFYLLCKKRRELPDKLTKKKEEKRTENVMAVVYEVIHTVNKQMQPCTQIWCQYEDDKKRKICFKSEKILGKVKVMVGDKCMVYYDPNDTNNCIVVPQANSK